MVRIPRERDRDLINVIRAGGMFLAGHGRYSAVAKIRLGLLKSGFGGWSVRGKGEHMWSLVPPALQNSDDFHKCVWNN